MLARKFGPKLGRAKELLQGSSSSSRPWARSIGRAPPWVNTIIAAATSPPAVGYKQLGLRGLRAARTTSVDPPLRHHLPADCWYHMRYSGA